MKLFLDKCLNGKKPYNQKVIAVLNYEFILYHSFVAPPIKMNSSVRSPPGSVSLKSVGIPYTILFCCFNFHAALKVFVKRRKQIQINKKYRTNIFSHQLAAGLTHLFGERR